MGTLLLVVVVIIAWFMGYADGQTVGICSMIWLASLEGIKYR